MTELRGAPPLGWPETLIARSGLEPLAAATLTSAAIFFVCVVGNNFAGDWQGLQIDGVSFYNATFGRMSLVVSVLIGALVAWPGMLARGALADFAAMRPGLDCDEDEASKLRSDLVRLDARSERRSRFVGVLVLPVAPVLMVATSAPGIAIFFPGSFRFNTAWSLIFTGLLFWLMGRALYFSVRQVGAYGRLAERLREPDPLDPGPIMAFGRGATRGALGWLGSASMAAFLLANPSFVGPLLPVLVFTLAVALSVFLGIVLPVRRRLRRTRHVELERVRAAARRERGALYDGEPSTRLATLLAWEEHVRNWSAWPFETPVAVRGVLLVLIPLGSWVGGALVERLLDWGITGG